MHANMTESNRRKRISMTLADERLIDRNVKILDQFAKGESMESIGRAFGISRQRIHQIINKHATPQDREARSLASRGVGYEAYELEIKGMSIKARSEPILVYWRFSRYVKGRGIPFKITFDLWWQLWQESGKWSQRGASANCYCLARKSKDFGFVPDNVEIRKNYEGWKGRNGEKLPVGVTRMGKSYVARIWIKRTAYQLGYFRTPEEAGAAFLTALEIDPDRIVSGDRSFLTPPAQVL
jgi:hypothetical protein